MNKTVELTCVVCPAGCRMTAELDENGRVISVKGNTCPRGKSYAESEITHPVRTLTSTVTVRWGENKAVMLPVRTSKPIPRESLFEAMAVIRTITLDAPVQAGDVLVRDFIEHGTDLIACKTIRSY